MHLLAIGLNHTTAPVSVRERVAFGPEEIAETIGHMRERFSSTQMGGIHEAAILSTCNRTEIYCAAEDTDAARDSVLGFICERKNVSRSELEPHIYTFTQEEAAKHTFRVASGLDSMVLGETQIVGQMKKAEKMARDAHGLGTMLNHLFQSTFTVAKEVRTATAIGANSVSLAAAAVRLALRLFGSLKDERVLFVGAGEMIELCAAHFAAQQPKAITIANRTLERGQVLARTVHADAIRLADLPEKIAGYDIIVSCTASALPIIGLGMIERAIKNGRYKPAKEGVYSDFNYRVAVAPAERRSADYNSSRNNLAWNKIIGKNITDPEQFPYSAVATKKWTVDDVKDLLRTHEHDIQKQDAQWTHTNSLGICRATTHESEVFEMNANPLLITGYRALARPCESPYIPFYPLARPAEGTAFMSWDKATAEHFKGTPEYFGWRSEWPVTTFVAAANTYDFQRQDQKDVRAFVEKLEAGWEKDVPAVTAHAKTLLKVSKEKAVEYLHAYNVRMLNEAQAAVAEKLEEKAPWTLAVMADSINPKSDEKVEVVLFSSGKLDATKADPKQTWGGVGRASIGNKITMSQKLAQPVKAEARDVDGDGLKDMVFTFTQKGLAQNMLAGANYDIWLHTYVDGKRVAAMDTAFIETEGYKGPAKRTQNADL